MDSCRDLHNQLETLSSLQRQALLLHLADDSPLHIQLDFIEWEGIARLLGNLDDIDTLIALAKHRMDYFADNDADVSGKSARIQSSIQLHKITDLMLRQYIAERVPYMNFQKPHYTVEKIQFAIRALYEMRSYLRSQPETHGNAELSTVDICMCCKIRGRNSTCLSCRYTEGKFSIKPILSVFPEMESEDCSMYASDEGDLSTLQVILNHFDQCFSDLGHPSHITERCP